MRCLIALFALAAALVSAGVAQAGGWATVSVDPLPNGIEAGETWRTEITVLQHGRTPLSGLEPLIKISNTASGATREFTASAADRTGRYDAQVVFPEAGSWDVVVDPQWWGEAVLTFGPVTVAGSPTGVLSPSDFPLLPLAAAALVLILIAGAAMGARRRWRPTPAR
jgi:hypothetical protein